MASCAGMANFSCTGPYGRLRHHIDCPRPVPMADTPWPIPRVPLPGPIDGILQEVPMADIPGVISRSWKQVLRSMEIYHGDPLPYGHGYIGKINKLEQVFADHFGKSYRDKAYRGDGEGTRNEHHRQMKLLLHDIRVSDRKYREALYDVIRYFELGDPTFASDWSFATPQVLDSMVSNCVRPHLSLGMKFCGNRRMRLGMKFRGKRRIRRRNKQRWRRALHRVTCAKANLLSCIRELIHEAMLYHLICSIGMAQDGSIELSRVSTEIDVTVIKVMIPLFPFKQYRVTSSIDLGGMFHDFYFNVNFAIAVGFDFYSYANFIEAVIQDGDGDGDGPRKYWIRRRQWTTKVLDSGRSIRRLSH